MSESSTLWLMLVIMIVSLVLTRRFVNPILLFTFGFFATVLGFYACRNLSTQVDDFAEYRNYTVSDACYVYALAIVGFVLPWLIPGIWLFSKGRRAPHYVVWSRWFFDAVSWMLIANVLVCCLILKRIPLLQMLRGSITIQTHLDSLSELPLGLMALQTTLGMSLAVQLASRLFLRSRGVLSGKERFHLPYIALIAAGIWQGNRQLLFFSIISVLFRYALGSRRRIRDTVKLYAISIVAIAAFIAVFIGIQSTRLQGVGSSQYEILGYLTWPAMNMQAIVKHVPLNADIGRPEMLLREVIPYRFRSGEYETYVMPHLAVPSSPSGFVAYLYLDYRNWGVFIGAIGLGLAAYWCYAKASASEHRTRILILIMWCCATSSIYSHFASLNNFWFPLLFLVVSEKLSHMKVQRVEVAKGIARSGGRAAAEKAFAE